MTHEEKRYQDTLSQEEIQLRVKYLMLQDAGYRPEPGQDWLEWVKLWKPSE